MSRQPAVRRRLEHTGQHLLPRALTLKPCAATSRTCAATSRPARSYRPASQSFYQPALALSAVRKASPPSQRPKRQPGAPASPYLGNPVLRWFGRLVLAGFQRIPNPDSGLPSGGDLFGGGLIAKTMRGNKSDPFSSSTYARANDPRTTGSLGANLGGESPASIVAHEWSRLQQTRVTERVRAPAPAKQALAQAQTSPNRLNRQPNRLKFSRKRSLKSGKPPTSRSRASSRRFASQRLEDAPPPGGRNSIAHAVEREGGRAGWSNFETAPFPYHGPIAGDSSRPFLNAGEAATRATSISAARSFGNLQTFSDDRVLLHIPAQFRSRTALRSWWCSSMATAPISPRTSAIGSRCRSKSRPRA